MTKKIGRPTLPKNEARGRFVSTRVSSKEYEEIMRVIRASGKPKTGWVRDVLLYAARANAAQT
jgi:hypothetical protein